MGNRLEMVFTKEEIARITEKVSNNMHTITVDVHGLKVKEAQRLLKNLTALNREGYDITVIHGYTHGTAIKNMLESDQLNNPRITGKEKVKGNYGRTVIKMNSAA